MRVLTGSGHFEDWSGLFGDATGRGRNVRGLRRSMSTDVMPPLPPGSTRDASYVFSTVSTDFFGKFTFDS